MKLSFFLIRFQNISDFVDFKWSDICSDAKKLVNTFNLSAENIVLPPSAWLVAVGILIQCLAHRTVSLQNTLNQPFFKQLFSKVNYGGKHVSIFVDELMNLV